jgi:hypothetical protein
MTGRGRRRAPGRGCRPCSRCGGRRSGSPGSCRCGSARSGRRCGPGCGGRRWPRRRPPPGGGEQPGAQDAHRLLLVLQLALLVLAADHDAGRQVRDPDGGVGGVDALPAGPGRAEDVDAQVVLVDLTSTCSASGITSTPAALVWMRPWRLGHRHPLDAVHAALELEQRVRRLAGLGVPLAFTATVTTCSRPRSDSVASRTSVFQPRARRTGCTCGAGRRRTAPTPRRPPPT